MDNYDYEEVLALLTKTLGEAPHPQMSVELGTYGPDDAFSALGKTTYEPAVFVGLCRYDAWWYAVVRTAGDTLQLRTVHPSRIVKAV